MAEHNLLGRLGEDAACFYLVQRDIRILERNWRSHHLELDIVAEDYGELIFVEVKTRRDERFADAAAAVDKNKQRLLVKAAQAYLQINRCGDMPFRFDIITVVGRHAPFEITHYPNAFSAASLQPDDVQDLFF